MSFQALVQILILWMPPLGADGGTVGDGRDKVLSELRSKVG